MRLWSRPTATRRGLVKAVASTRTCTSTRSWRVPSRVTVTMLPAAGLLVPRKKNRRRIAHFLQTIFSHREHADFVCRAETILDGAHYAITAAAVALEVEHRVDHVFEHAWSRDHALLGHVANQQHSGTRGLGVTEQRGRGFAQLRDCAWRRIAVLGRHGLNRIDDQNFRMRLRALRYDPLNRGLRDQAQPSAQTDRGVWRAVPPAAAILRRLRTARIGWLQVRPQPATAASTCRYRDHHRAVPPSP